MCAEVTIVSICKVLANEIQSRINTEVASTEEMMYCISQANKKIQTRVTITQPARERMRRNPIPPIQDTGKTVVVSMDVCALYPSISVSLAMRMITKTIKQSKLIWEEINLEILERYVSLTIDTDDLKKHKIIDCVPKAKATTTLQSWI